MQKCSIPLVVISQWITDEMVSFIYRPKSWTFGPSWYVVSARQTLFGFSSSFGHQLNKRQEVDFAASCKVPSPAAFLQQVFAPVFGSQVQTFSASYNARQTGCYYHSNACAFLVARYKHSLPATTEDRQVVTIIQMPAPYLHNNTIRS